VEAQQVKDKKREEQGTESQRNEKKTQEKQQQDETRQRQEDDMRRKEIESIQQAKEIELKRKEEELKQKEVELKKREDEIKLSEAKGKDEREKSKSTSPLVNYKEKEIQRGIVLGRGAFGIVYACTINHARYAVKVFTDGKNQKTRASFEQEVAILSQLYHPNLVQLIGVCQSDELMIVMNIFDSSMEQVLEKKKTENTWFSEREIVQWCIQLLEALEYLHSKHIAHRDLKVYNSLLQVSFLIFSAKTFWFNSRESAELLQFI
jgi:serine/threonine protein kinase